MIQLFLVTLAFGVVGGLGFAYLQWSNANGRRGIRHWSIWAGTMLAIFALAHALGFALKLPGVTDGMAFDGVAVIGAGFAVAYLWLRSRLAK